MVTSSISTKSGVWPQLQHPPPFELSEPSAPPQGARGRAVHFPPAALFHPAGVHFRMGATGSSPTQGQALGEELRKDKFFSYESYLQCLGFFLILKLQGTAIKIWIQFSSHSKLKMTHLINFKINPKPPKKHPAPQIPRGQGRTTENARIPQALG